MTILRHSAGWTSRLAMLGITWQCPGFRAIPAAAEPDAIGCRVHLLTFHGAGRLDPLSLSLRVDGRVDERLHAEGVPYRKEHGSEYEIAGVN